MPKNLISKSKSRDFCLRMTPFFYGFFVYEWPFFVQVGHLENDPCMTHNQLLNWQNKVPVRVTKHHTQQTHVYTPTPAQVVKLWPVTLCVLTHPQRSSTCDSLGFHQDKKCESNRLEKYWLKTFSSMVESFLQWRLCDGHKTSKSTVSRQPRQQYAQKEEKLSDTGAGGAGTYTTRETQELSGLLRLVQSRPTSVHTTTAGHPHVCGGMDHPDGLGGGMATRKYLHQPVFQWPMYHTVSTTLYRQVYNDPLQGSSLYKWPSLVKHARSRLTKSIVHTWTWQCTVNGTQM